MNFNDPNNIFVIAEAGSNWKCGDFDDDLNQAKNLIKVAAKSGANAVKFQTYRPETTYVSNPGTSDYLSKIGTTENINDIFEKHSMPYEMIPELVKICKNENILFMSTPFSLQDAKSIDEFVLVHKIASFEINHIPLLRKVAKTKKPVIMSIGASSLSEIEEAVNTLRSEGCGELILLKCTSAYPALHSDANLVTIPHLKNLFNCEVGLSDHTKGIAAPIVAVGLGAMYIEKHFCLDRSKKGVDSEFSLEPDEFKMLTREVRNAYKTIGVINYGLIDSEKKGDAGKRSIYVSDFIKSGEKITEKNIKIIRPGYGMHPRYFDKVIGKIVLSDLHPGDKLSFNKLK